MGADLLRNLRKDIRIEARSRFAFTIAIAFAVTVTLSLSLAGGGIRFEPRVLAIFLWIVLFFSAMNGLSHIFIREEERGTALFLRIASSLDAIFLGKLIFNIAFMIAIECVVVPLFIFFMQADVFHPIHFICTILAGGLALSAATTILAAMAARAGGRGSLFTIVSFPVTLPVLWVAIAATAASLHAAAPSWNPILFLLAFSGFVAAMSFLLFRYVWLDE